VVSYTTFSPLLENTSGPFLWSFPRVTPPGCYPASCSMERGLSSGSYLPPAITQPAHYPRSYLPGIWESTLDPKFRHKFGNSVLLRLLLIMNSIHSHSSHSFAHLTRSIPTLVSTGSTGVGVRPSIAPIRRLSLSKSGWAQDQLSTKVHSHAGFDETSSVSSQPAWQSRAPAHPYSRAPMHPGNLRSITPNSSPFLRNFTYFKITKP